MEYVIHGREPADALRFFEEISAVPRASRNEAEAKERYAHLAKLQELYGK